MPRPRCATDRPSSPDPDLLQKPAQIRRLVINMLRADLGLFRSLPRPTKIIVHQDGCATERMGGNKVARNVVEKGGSLRRGVYAGKNCAIGFRIGLWTIRDGADVPMLFKQMRQGEPFQHAARVVTATVGEDETAARQIRDRAGETSIGVESREIDI